jgi:putative transposase
MSAVKILVHFVWTTKNRFPFLVPEIRQDVFSHIKQNAYSKNIDLLEINGYLDHVHCLVNLNHNQSVGKIAQLMKGESSYWVNYNRIINDDVFQWQSEYFAESIGIREKGKISGYIRKQEIHHSEGSANRLRELHLIESSKI